MSDMTCIERFNSVVEAEVAKGLLDGAGIEAIISAGDSSGLETVLSMGRGVKLYVLAKNEQAAREVLAAAREDGLDGDG